MTQGRKIVEIVEQATNLSEKIKESDNVEFKFVTSCIDEMFEMIKELGKALDDVEERLEILEEIMEE